MTSRYGAAILFVFKARRRARSRAYVTEAATLKTGKRASKIGRSFVEGPLGGPCRGFTLLELIVALAVVVLLVSLTPPLLSQAMPSLELKSAARKLTAGLRLARESAIRAHSETTLTLDVEERWFRISARPQKNPLPEGIEIRLETAELELGDGRLGAIRFFPDGGSTGGRITLRRGNSGYEIGVEWLTGRVNLAGLEDPRNGS